MQYDRSVVTRSNISHLELINKRRTNQATTKTCVGQRAPARVWQFALCELIAYKICYDMLDAPDIACGSAYGGRVEQMFDCLVFYSKL
jgi:hypothetical protein